MKDGAKITKGCFIAYDKIDKTLIILSPNKTDPILWDNGDRKEYIDSFHVFNIHADLIAQVLNLKIKKVSDGSLMGGLIVIELI